MDIIQTFFLGNIDQENVFYDILERKNAFLGYKNNNFKKSKNSHFSKGFPMVLVQTWPFFKLFFLGNRGLEIVFYDILEQKKSLFRPKKKEVQKVEKLTFFQMSSMALVQKWPFSQLFLCNISQKSVFYDFLERKNAFFGYKKNTFKKSKNWHFSKGVNPWFRTKNGHFSIFFFGNIA